MDRAGEFRSIREINNEIRRLNLAAYAPLRYVLPHKQAAYDAKYSTQIRGGEGFFRQVDREESLIHLLRVNVLKRMESSVSSFALTLKRQLADVEATLARIEAQAEAVEEIDIEDVDIDDPAFESLLVGRKVKVLLKDVDLVRWRQDLIEDRNRLATLLAAARQVDAARDAKLTALREVIEPSAGIRSIPAIARSSSSRPSPTPPSTSIENLRPGRRTSSAWRPRWSRARGTTRRRLPNLRKDFAQILTAFSPRSKERPEDLAGEGEIDLLIATDCISEGQNLQDCDLAHQLRHPLESGAHHPALRPHRPHRLAERAHPARQLLAQHGAGGIHQSRAAGQRPHGAARYFRHRRGEPHRAAVRQPDERSGIPPQAAAQAAGRRDRPRRPVAPASPSPT